MPRGAGSLSRRKENSGVARRQLNRIYFRDKGICQICFLPCTREEASRDHIIELFFCTKREATNDNNMRLAHKQCNNDRSNSPGSPEFIPEQRQNETVPLTQSLAQKFIELGFNFDS